MGGLDPGGHCRNLTITIPFSHSNPTHTLALTLTLTLTLIQVAYEDAAEARAAAERLRAVMPDAATSWVELGQALGLAVTQVGWGWWRE